MSSANIRLAQCMAGAAVGGAENFYLRLVCAMANDPGFEQMAFTRRNEYRVPQIRAAGVPVTRFRFGSPLHLVDRWRYRRALKHFNPDIVLTYMNRASAITPRGRYTLVCRLGHFYNLKHYHHADYWIGNTQGICAYLIENGMPSERVEYIPNFVDESDCAPIPRASFDTPPDQALLLAAGRLHANKAFDTLLQALVQVPEATLWLAGEGPEQEALRLLADSLKISQRVRFLGWREDIASLMRTADLFVCPSRHEGLAGIVQESWFNNCPVVATASQGPSELIEHEVSGLLSPVDDTASLANNILRALSDKALCERLVKNGKLLYQREYSQAIITQQYKDFFHRILQR